MKKLSTMALLRQGGALSAFALLGAGALVSPSASAQETAAPQAAVSADEGETIIVTGSLFKRRIDSETPSPVTTLSADSLAKRGITNVADAIHSLAADGAGTLPGAFSANGAFASGAAAVSLRGLTTSSTVVLFDGLRGAYYPLADDGTRSFVDLNTIPDAIVERVEVLKDGASSTYGADAIAGVVNIITKRQITGLQGTAEAGISSRGDAAEQRLSLTGGYGDLDDQGFNFYVSAEYQRDKQLMNNKRGYPFNSGDLTNVPADDGSPGPNNNQNGQGVVPNNATTSAVVRPATLSDPANILSGVAISGGQTMVLNPAGCGAGTTFASDSGGTYCQQDLVNQYGVIQPNQTRFGVTARGTVKVGESAEAYLMGTYYQNKVSYLNSPYGTNSRQPTTIRGIVLPALLRDGTVNPQNPYANIIDPVTGQRESALLQYRFGGITSTTTNKSKSFRIAGGINGTFGDNWSYNAQATYMQTTLDNDYTGLLSYKGLTDAILDGTYNFINPAANSQAVLDSISPDVHATAKSKLWQVQGVVTKDLFQLAGGPLQVAIGGQARYESINDPVQDPADPTGTYSNYAIVGMNTFSAIGHRYNQAAFFELKAPVLDNLEIDASGRYDHYSQGFNHFSPKLGVIFTPIRQIALRGTYSKGFRAPSIPESSGNVIGYTTVTPPQSVINQHLNPDGTPNGYVNAYGLGQFAVGNPNLKPETSENYTFGTIVQPTRWLSLTADYYHIQKKNLIIGGADFGTAVANYYAGQPLPSGYSILLNPVDPDHPNAIQTVQVVSAQYENAQKLIVSGLDFSAQVNLKLSDDVRFTSAIEATRVLKYNLYTSSGVQKFVGTVGPYAYTSGAGTPKWRGNWQNTIEYGPYTLTGTAYYTGGYIDGADDATGAGTASGSAPCDAAAGLSSNAAGTGAQQCHVRRFINFDLTGSIKVNDNFTFYANVINVFDAKPPFDPAQYSANNYNPAYAQTGIIGRYFRVGANFKF